MPRSRSVWLTGESIMAARPQHHQGRQLCCRRGSSVPSSTPWPGHGYSVVRLMGEGMFSQLQKLGGQRLDEPEPPALHSSLSPFSRPQGC